MYNANFPNKITTEVIQRKLILKDNVDVYSKVTPIQVIMQLTHTNLNKNGN